MKKRNCKKVFPFAYDSDFIHLNGGVPEIKIRKVLSEKILGFIVKGDKSDKLIMKLENKGISLFRILKIDSNCDELSQLIDFKSKLLNEVSLKK